MFHCPVVVDKLRRGQGLGEQILILAEDFVKSRGISHMFVSCSVENGPYFLNQGYRYVEPKVVTIGSGVSIMVNTDCNIKFIGIGLYTFAIWVAREKPKPRTKAYTMSCQ